MKIIHPKNFFNNPFHYKYEKCLRINIEDEYEYKEEIESLIYDDLLESYKEENKIFSDKVGSIYDLPESVQDNAEEFFNNAYCYFIIDWYFIHAFFMQNQEWEEAEIEAKNYIEEFINFMNPNEKITFTNCYIA